MNLNEIIFLFLLVTFSSSFSLLPIFTQLSPSILSTPASSSIHHYQKIFVCFSSSLSLPFPIYFIALLSISSIPDFSFAVSLSTQFYHFIFSDSALAEKYSPTICSFPLFWQFHFLVNLFCFFSCLFLFVESYLHIYNFLWSCGFRCREWICNNLLFFPFNSSISLFFFYFSVCLSFFFISLFLFISLCIISYVILSFSWPCAL